MIYKDIDAMTVKQREKMLYFILPLYALEKGNPEVMREALAEPVGRYTPEDVILFKKIIEKLHGQP